MCEQLIADDNLKFTLLEDGANAFPRIINAIKNAKTSIAVNMFIWRADNIGLEIAKEILDAADRGVNVQISVDRYGFVLELAEESMHSFFHQNPTVIERIKVFALKVFYGTKKVDFSACLFPETFFVALDVYRLFPETFSLPGQLLLD